MKKLPLYNPKFAHTLPPAEAHNVNCMKCDAGGDWKKRCVLPEYDKPTDPSVTGILYVIQDYPLAAEMTVQPEPRPLVSPFGKNIRTTLRGLWCGGIVYDNAVRCNPGKFALKVNNKGLVSSPEVLACAPYTARGIEQANQRGKVTRIITIGQTATGQVLGEKVNLRAAPGGYGWLLVGDLEVPVFWVLNPNEWPVRGNTFHINDFFSQLRKAATVPPPFPSLRNLYTNVMETADDAAEFLQWARGHQWLEYDTEGSGVEHGCHHPHYGCLCISFADDKGVSYVANSDHLYAPGPVRDAVLSVLTDARIGKCGQNIKFDNRSVFFAFGVEVRGPQLDVRLIRKMEDAESATDLESMAGMVGLVAYKQEMDTEVAKTTAAARRAVKAKAKQLGVDEDTYAANVLANVGSGKVYRNMALAPTEVIEAAVSAVKGAKSRKYSYGLAGTRLTNRYNATDGITTSRLRKLMTERWNTPDGKTRERVVKELLMPASMAFERVERRGFKVSMDNIKSFTQYLDSQQREVWAALSPLVPDWFSPESDPDRRRLLFQDLGLPVLGVNEETQNEVADDAVLEALCQDFPDEPVLPLLRRWNKLSTMRERYGDGRSILVNKPVKGLVQHICHCGRVHATYNMDVARTGRLSCSDPALHGWTSPSRDPEEGPFYGRMCRDEFTCDPGNVIIQADYRQLEYFIAAMLFDDPLMQKYCAMGVDPHTEAAKIIRHLFTARPWEQLSDKEKKRIRSYAKTIVFAQLYGQGIPALARRLGCSKKFAEDVAAALFGQFPTLMRNIQKLRQQVEREGGVYTWWDGKPARWRPLYEAGVQGSDKWSTAQRAKAARAGVNTPVQGTANEFCVASVVALVWAFAENGIEASVVGSIHDSVIVESSVKDARTVIEVMQDVMTGWPSYSPSGTPVKLGVDIEVGLKWGSLKAWEPDKGLAGMGLSL